MYHAYLAFEYYQANTLGTLVALQLFAAGIALVASWQFARGPQGRSDRFFIGFFAISAALDADALYTLSGGELWMLRNLLASHWGLRLLSTVALILGVVARIAARNR